MNTMSEKSFGYCDQCREKLMKPSDVYYIIFDEPSGAIEALTGGNKEKFKLCQPCYRPKKESIIKGIMKK